MLKSTPSSVKQALTKLIAPVAIAAVTAFLCQPLYMAGGKCDYRLLALLIEIPFWYYVKKKYKLNVNFRITFH